MDFIKIKDYAVININNMIPVPEGEYTLVDVNGTKDPHYRFLLQAVSREINRQKNRILKNASIVYKHKERNGENSPLAKRTNNFQVLEKLVKIIFRDISRALFRPGAACGFFYNDEDILGEAH